MRSRFQLRNVYLCWLSFLLAFLIYVPTLALAAEPSADTKAGDAAGRAKEFSRARELYARACKNGDPIGCRNLGIMHEYGIGGGPRNKIRAMRLYDQACSGGDAGGCFNLGLIFNKGEGAPLDHERSRKYFVLACAAGDAEGCYNAAGYFYTGVEVPKDQARARSLFEQACKGGYARGCADHAVMLQSGIGGSKDQSRARELFKKSCAAGYSKGCRGLGHHVTAKHAALPSPKTKPGSTGHSSAKPRNLMHECDAGDAESCYEFGSTRRGIAAAEYYEKACKGGFTKGCYDGAFLFNFSSDEPDHKVRARTLYELACNGRYAASCYVAGKMWNFGKGGKKDVSRAKAFFKRACALGYKKACPRTPTTMNRKVHRK